LVRLLAQDRKEAEDFFERSPDPRPISPSHIGAEDQVFPNRYEWEKMLSFRRVCDSAIYDRVGRHPSDLFTLEAHLSITDRNDATDGAKKSALPGTIGPQENHDLPRANVQIHATKGFKLAKPNRHSLEFKHGVPPRDTPR
jgi:hypothetical protein